MKKRAINRTAQLFVFAFFFFMEAAIVTAASTNGEELFTQGVEEMSSGDSLRIIDGINIIEEAAKAGHIPAIRRLTWIYSTGFSLPENFIKDHPGFYPDYKKVTLWTNVLATKYDQLPEKFAMALFYRDGTGIEQDLEKSNSWFSEFKSALEALENSDPIKYLYLSQVYLCGYGVDVDIEKFHEFVSTGVGLKVKELKEIDHGLSSKELTIDALSKQVCN